MKAFIYYSKEFKDIRGGPIEVHKKWYQLNTESWAEENGLNGQDWRQEDQFKSLWQWSRWEVLRE